MASFGVISDVEVRRKRYEALLADRVKQILRSQRQQLASVESAIVSRTLTHLDEIATTTGSGGKRFVADGQRDARAPIPPAPKRSRCLPAEPDDDAGAVLSNFSQSSGADIPASLLGAKNAAAVDSDGEHLKRASAVRPPSGPLDRLTKVPSFFVGSLSSVSLEKGRSNAVAAADSHPAASAPAGNDASSGTNNHWFGMLAIAGPTSNSRFSAAAVEAEGGADEEAEEGRLHDAPAVAAAAAAEAPDGRRPLVQPKAESMAAVPSMPSQPSVVAVARPVAAAAHSRRPSAAATSGGSPPLPALSSGGGRGGAGGEHARPRPEAQPGLGAGAGGGAAQAQPSFLDKPGEPRYKFIETVRGRDARAALHGTDCDCCRGFYDAVENHPAQQLRRIEQETARLKAVLQAVKGTGRIEQETARLKAVLQAVKGTGTGAGQAQPATAAAGRGRGFCPAAKGSGAEAVAGGVRPTGSSGSFSASSGCSSSADSHAGTVSRHADGIAAPPLLTKGIVGGAAPGGLGAAHAHAGAAAATAAGSGAGAGPRGAAPGVAGGSILDLDLCNHASRHRYVHGRDKSPEGYWRLDDDEDLPGVERFDELPAAPYNPRLEHLKPDAVALQGRHSRRDTAGGLSQREGRRRRGTTSSRGGGDGGGGAAVRR